MDNRASQQSLFPRINRFITEFPYKLHVFVGSIIVVSVLLAFGIVQQAQLFVENQTVMAKQVQKRQQLTQKLLWWEHVSKQYTGYRDAYLQIAALQYRLGDKAGAQGTISKVLELDPNSQEALVLQEKLSQKE